MNPANLPLVSKIKLILNHHGKEPLIPNGSSLLCSAPVTALPLPVTPVPSLPDLLLQITLLCN